MATRSSGGDCDPRAEPRADPALPRLARACAATLVVGAAIGFATVLVDGTLSGAFALRSSVLITAALAFAAVTYSHARPITFTWRGKSIGVHPDEIAVFAGFILAPTPVIVVAGMLASVTGQLVARRGGLRVLVNTALATASLAFAHHAYHGVLPHSTPFLAATAAVLAHAVTAHVLLTVFFATFTEARLRDVIAWPELVTQAWLVVIGVAGGVFIVTFTRAGQSGFGTEQLIGLALAGFVLVGARALLTADSTRRREVQTRRALAEAAREIVGQTDLSVVFRAAVNAARDAVPLQEISLTLTRECGGAVEWGVCDVTARGARPVSVRVALHKRDGTPMGHLEFTADGSRLGRDDLTDQAELLGAWLSLSIEQVTASRQRDDVQQRLDVLLDAAADAVLVLTPDGRVAWANAPGRTLLAHVGAPSDARFDDVLSPESASAWADGSTGRGATVMEVETRATDTGALTLQVSASWSSWEGHESVRVLVARDVTQARELERRLRSHHDAVTRAKRLSELGALVAGLAHEINNPLTFMTGYAELALLELDEHEARPDASHERLRDARDHVDRVLKGCGRISEITRSIRTAATGASTARDALVDVPALAHAVRDLVRGSVPDGVEFVTDVPEECARVRGHVGELHQVLLNLVKNAFEAMDGHAGRVALRAARVGDHVHLSVEDEGPGIPPEIREHLFQPFRTTKAEGTGLGLSIVNGIVVEHGGRVRVESARERGTTFVVELPAAT